jgi:aryl-alcohol dehydrogenase-like predicted oxidoreductase
MSTNQVPITRRRFLQTSAALGAGAMLLPAISWADAPGASIPRRKFGRTGVDVPALGLGCMFDITENLVILRQALDHGVNYWDTAPVYGNGRSEIGIGSFLERNSAVRKNIFLVTKASRARGASDMTHILEQSFERLKTDYVDLYFLHGIDDISSADLPEIKAWAESAKKSGKIRYFGFSTHSNMERCLSGAAKLGWIDGIMFTYNYRLMDTPEMKAAIDACFAAGIGLTAMKTQGARLGFDTPAQAALLDALGGRGFTPGQAKLKAVMDDPRIAVACVQMPNLKVFRQNVAAALDKASLSTAERTALRRHADATCNAYCGGCSRLCESALGGAVPVRDVLRYLMYHDHYTELDARALYAELAPEVRSALPGLDYSQADGVCPRGLPIGSLMRAAGGLLA